MFAEGNITGARAPTAAPQVLFGGHLLGFAFLAHKLQFAFRRFDLRSDFLLHTRRCFFEFRRELHVAVVFKARARGDLSSHDHVFLQAAQVIDRAVDAGFGKHAGRLLEAGSRDKAVGGERCLGDTQQQRTSNRRTTS